MTTKNIQKCKKIEKIVVALFDSQNARAKNGDNNRELFLAVCKAFSEYAVMNLKINGSMAYLAYLFYVNLSVRRV